MRRARGLTLVDTLVGVSLVFFSLLVIMNVLPTAARTVEGSRSNMTALHIARGQLEQITSKAFSTIDASTLTAVTITNTLNGQSQSITYTPTVAVSTVSASLKDVAVTVTWTDNNSSHSVVLETLVANK